MAKPSNVVDLNDENANMYGCQPCPKCGSRYRCVFNYSPYQITCDDCGHKQAIAEDSTL